MDVLREWKNNSRDQDELSYLLWEGQALTTANLVPMHCDECSFLLWDIEGSTQGPQQPHTGASLAGVRNPPAGGGWCWWKGLAVGGWSE